jgi:hypothetical protein|tara:strand:+ start:542 stop:763 length:222 start_codon:yes stop_codon:yes gene_type:complete
MEKHTKKSYSSEFKMLNFRLEQLEIALMNLMFVVANQEEELPQFKDNIKKAESMASQGDKFISVLSDSNKAEA